jgi:small subunit ribosomal protein S7
MTGRITKSEWQLRPDARYKDRVLAKFINCVMHDGKKAVAQRVVYDALDQIQARLEKEKPENFPATERPEAVEPELPVDHHGGPR